MLKIWYLIICIAFILISCTQKQSEKSVRPNIVLIMCDDMGYSDLGCYGSEINTPNLDGLANQGIRFTQFYNAARCCPSRASLISGLYPHEAGMGRMVADKPDKAAEFAYRGYLSDNCVTLAEVLKSGGYHTMMSGKWHIGEFHPYYPVDRGFQKYYGLISGACNYFNHTKGKGFKRHFAYGNEPYTPPTEDFYFTDAITDTAVSFLEAEKDSEDPFFLYLAYTAPHYPLHALPEDIKKYEEFYDIGWDSLRIMRYRKQLELGVIDSTYILTPRDSVNPAWESLDKQTQEEMSLKMAIYAAMIDRMDQGIGKILSKLKEMDKDKNTIVMFLSDNGACAETEPLGGDWRNNGAPIGSEDSYLSYGGAWANASNTPFKYYKQYIHEGGIRTPFIAYWPGNMKNVANTFVDEPVHVIDIMSTICDLGRVDYPIEFNGDSITPTMGKSLVPLFEGSYFENHTFLAWEHFENRGIRKGDWKLVARKGEPWELYDLKSDPTEMKNVVHQKTKIVEELLKTYNKWAKKVGV